ncbi:SWI/SNF-related matrix-associated actin-dependent regulator of chromatin subfamily E member 1-like isoform X3 [Daphnia carinata]|uniref:SWI/SNF-related matrix-associated actin-dependent regulator of chromatin subfamily E member 1-like isoform X3 n=1 Tax=Daphnia carinata TaxID=120202 RepID=UPI00257AFED0|nr:SWI/SNF-related matrix-associated actin-dependent regulator of chromatin subfamily E member 1-like isoform X3 [Daphnia carinata]
MALPQNYRQNAMASPAPIPSTGSSQRLRASGSQGMSKDASNQNPFVMNPHGHPQFNPQKLGTKFASAGSSSLKPPKAPEKPLMPYMRYSRKVWDEVKGANQELKLWEIGKIIGQMWRDLPDVDKQEFVEEYETEKIEYERTLKAYHNSPAYQAYITAKSKAQQGGDEKESASERGMSAKAGFSDRRIEIQPAEDEEDIDDGMSVKHVAHARYVRNHRLVHEIFSDVVVPDVRSVVTTARMQVLKRQVHSLTMHQKKLETELQQIEEKFDSKKRKFVESSAAFQDDLIRTCRKPIDEETFQQMVEQQTEIIKKEREREKERQNELMREREAAAAVAALQAEKEAAIAAAAAAASAASAPAEAMETEDVPTPEVKEESTTAAPPASTTLSVSSEAKAVETAAPVPEETPSAPVPMETEEMTPTTEAVKVDEIPSQEPSQAAFVPPQAPVVETPAVPVVETAPVVEPVPMAETTSVIEKPALVESTSHVEIAPVATPVAESDSVADTALPVRPNVITHPSVEPPPCPPVLQGAQPETLLAPPIIEAAPEPCADLTAPESTSHSHETHEPPIQQPVEDVPVSSEQPIATAIPTETPSPVEAPPTVVPTNESIPTNQPASVPSEPVLKEQPVEPEPVTDKVATEVQEATFQNLPLFRTKSSQQKTSHKRNKQDNNNLMSLRQPSLTHSRPPKHDFKISQFVYD